MKWHPKLHTVRYTAGSQGRRRGWTMRKSMVARALAPIVVPGLTLGATACGTSAQTGGGSGGSGGQAVTGLQIMVPNAPGSGYDLTARAAAKATEDAGMARNVEVFNAPGASGTVGLQRVVNEKGNGKLLMQMGLGVVGAVYTNLRGDAAGHHAHREADRGAGGGGRAGRLAVSDAGPALAGLEGRPKGTPAGGASAPGGPDHLALHLFGQAAGVDPKQVNYVSYDGGGELLTALLGSQITFGVTGLGEILDQVAAGQVRVLARAERVTSRRDDPSSPEKTPDKSPEKPPDKAPEDKP